MKAMAAMTRNVVCVESDDSLIDAYQIMTEWEIRHLPVLDGRQVVGVLSDRDILIRSWRGDEGVQVPNIPVAEAMTSNPITCLVSADISAIGEAMITHKIDCLPVVDDEEDLVGLVTSTDLIQLLVDRSQPTDKLPLPFNYRVYAGARPGMATTAV